MPGGNGPILVSHDGLLSRSQDENRPQREMTRNSRLKSGLHLCVYGEEVLGVLSAEATFEVASRGWLFASLLFCCGSMQSLRRAGVQHSHKTSLDKFPKFFRK